MNFNKINNNHGAVLIIVLLTVVLIMLFSTVMMNSVMTTAKQNEVIEANYRATHVVEMGATFVQHTLADYFGENGFETSDSYLQELESTINEKVDKVEIDPDYPNTTFEISEAFEYEHNENFSRIMIVLTGYDSNYEQDLTLTFTIGGSSDRSDKWEDVSSSPPPPPEDADEEYDEQQTWKNNNCEDLSDSSVYLKDGGSIQCNMTTQDLYVEGDFDISSSNSLTVTGNATFDDVDISGLSQLFIHGHAHFTSVLSSENNPNSEYLSCGNSRFHDGVEYRGEFKVNMHTISDNTFSLDNGSVQFGGDTLLLNGLELSNASLHAGGDLIIEHNEQLDAANYLANIQGDITMSDGDLIILNADGDEALNPESSSVTYEAEPPTFPECDDVTIPSFGDEDDFEVILDDIQY
ncbi:hypothetical protein [Alkalibacillus haloalkaliphilus]|uniref:Uncharacterized protein n=1 Tax=Alkalibacillus haloalkaliphilus TaxID=94136 RepID=A0A511W8Z0_9BACI|nr:hypothetical protein [Alkalibacillus haloalkaliphilus]GEN46818.1 hypothetical protein AHA02nite_25940 [Alkalibacillus haloalkaliphilus]